jgi:hypothetical protein
LLVELWRLGHVGRLLEILDLKNVSSSLTINEIERKGNKMLLSRQDLPGGANDLGGMYLNELLLQKKLAEKFANTRLSANLSRCCTKSIYNTNYT